LDHLSNNLKEPSDLEARICFNGNCDITMATTIQNSGAAAERFDGAKEANCVSGVGPSIGGVEGLEVFWENAGSIESRG
jgi:hypothetical protein